MQAGKKASNFVFSAFLRASEDPTEYTENLLGKSLNMGNCKLCGQFKDLAKAHIIPRSFFLRAKGNSKNLLEARRNDRKLVQDWQNGIWDDKILCHTCEGGFSLWDDYGFRLLGIPPGKDALPKDDEEMKSLFSRNIDYVRLKLFVLSVIWRASVSNQPFYSKVQLGRYENDIADIIRNRDAGQPDQFSIVLFRLIGQCLPDAIFAPFMQRDPEGITFTLLFLPSIRIWVKMDDLPFPKMLEPYVLKPDAKTIFLPMGLNANELGILQNGLEIFRRSKK